MNYFLCRSINMATGKSASRKHSRRRLARKRSQKTPKRTGRRRRYSRKQITKKRKVVSKKESRRTGTKKQIGCGVEDEKQDEEVAPAAEREEVAPAAEEEEMTADSLIESSKRLFPQRAPRVALRMLVN